MRRGVQLFGYSGIALLVGAGMVRLLFEGSGPQALALAVVGLFLFLVYFFRAGPEVQRFLGRRSTREGGNVFGTTVFVLGILILVNVLASRFSTYRDLTADRLFTLAPETIQALRDAPEVPEVWVMHPEGSAVGAQMISILEAARLQVPSLKFHEVDPDRDPALAFRFGLTEFSTVVQVGERQEIFPEGDEESFTAAVLRASRSEGVRIGFLSGHGEAYPTDEAPGGLRMATELLHRRGYVTRGVNLLLGGSMTGEVEALVIAGPGVELRPEELDSLAAYADAGGRLLVLLDPDSPATLDPLLESFGLRYQPRFLADPDQRDPQTIVPTDLSSHPVVLPLRDRNLFTVLRGVGEVIRERDVPGVRNAGLLWSGPRTVPVGEPTAVPQRRLLAAAAERGGDDRRPLTRLVLVGDLDFATNSLFGTLGNGDLFLGSLRWLAEEGSTVTLRPRPRSSRPVVIGRHQGRALVVVFTGLLPLLVLGAGAAVWWRRR